MKISYRQGTIADLQQIKALAMLSWKGFQDELTEEHWKILLHLLTNDATFIALLQNSYCILAETEHQDLAGMAYLVSSGNPTDIYDKEWSYIRFLSVDPSFQGQGIGRQLTEYCIHKAKENKETTIALHTSEMMGKAIRIYENLGFEISHKLEPRLGKKYWLYKLQLDIGS